MTTETMNALEAKADKEMAALHPGWSTRSHTYMKTWTRILRRLVVEHKRLTNP
jgi:hypothetical protein